jgi:hypothetical protein
VAVSAGLEKTSVWPLLGAPVTVSVPVEVHPLHAVLLRLSVTVSLVVPLGEVMVTTVEATLLVTPRAVSAAPMFVAMTLFPQLPPELFVTVNEPAGQPAFPQVLLQAVPPAPPPVRHWLLPQVEVPEKAADDIVPPLPPLR